METLLQVKCVLRLGLNSKQNKIIKISTTERPVNTQNGNVRKKGADKNILIVVLCALTIIPRYVLVRLF